MYFLIITLFLALTAIYYCAVLILLIVETETISFKNLFLCYSNIIIGGFIKLEYGN